MNPVEVGDPRADKAAFRRVLGQFATGVAVVTANSPDGLVGMTSNSFSSVSLDPPLVLWSIRNDSTSFDAFLASRYFAVNILGSHQTDISQRFAKSGPEKFVGVSYSSGVGGAPLLDDVVATLECSTETVFDGGDHKIIMGRVERYSRYERSALVFAQGQYAITAEHPGTRGGGKPSPAGNTVGGKELLASLLIRAYGALANTGEEARRIANVTLAQARLLRTLELRPGERGEDLLPQLMLSANSAADAIEQCVETGLVDKDAAGRLNLTTKGRERLGLVLSHAERLEDAIVSTVAADDIACVRKVLAALISRA